MTERQKHRDAGGGDTVTEREKWHKDDELERKLRTKNGDREKWLVSAGPAQNSTGLCSLHVLHQARPTTSGCILTCQGWT